MNNKNINLGPRETELIMGLEKEDKIVFNIEDAKEILGEKGSAVKKVIYRLKNKNRITQIERGKYILSPARAGVEGFWSEHSYKIVPVLIEEYYISYWSALNYWEFTDQLSKTTYVACKRSKKSIEVKGQRIKFIRINDKKFYGCTEEKMDEKLFNIATIEKAIIDSLDKPDYAGGIKTVVRGLKSKKDDIDFEKLVELTNKFPNQAVKRRLGHLLDELNLLTLDLEKSLLEDFEGYRWLDYTEDKEEFEYDKKWGLKLNTKVGEIHG